MNEELSLDGLAISWDELDHPQAPARLPSGEVIAVDELMANLLPELWAGGLETFYSCQGEPTSGLWATPLERAYVLFRKSSASVELLQLLQRESEPWGSALVEHRLRNRFSRKAVKREFQVEHVSANAYGPDRICLRFPQEHIPELFQLAKNFSS